MNLNWTGLRVLGFTDATHVWAAQAREPNGTVTLGSNRAQPKPQARWAITMRLSDLPFAA